MNAMSRFAIGFVCCVAVGLAVLAAGRAGATDQQGRYFMMGPGQSACRDFVTALERQDAMVFAAWVSGYMTAMNLALPDTYSIGGHSNDEQLMRSLGNWCQANPDQLFGTAALRLVQGLKANRLRLPPPS